MELGPLVHFDQRAIGKVEHCARVTGSAQHLAGANFGVGSELLVRVAFDQLEGAVDGLDAGLPVAGRHHDRRCSHRRQISCLAR